MNGRTIWRRNLLPLALTLLTFAATAAFAASLGGVNSQNLGADISVVASCDDDGVAISFGHDYDPDAGAYRATDVTVSGISEDCDQEIMVIWVADSNGVVAQTVSVVDTQGGAVDEMTLPLMSNHPLVADVERVVIIFQGEISPLLFGGE